MKGNFYGSEVFEINANLLAKVLAIAKSTKLSDTPQAIAYRKFDRYFMQINRCVLKIIPPYFLNICSTL